jgi:hypothetical protein
MSGPTLTEQILAFWQHYNTCAHVLSLCKFQGNAAQDAAAPASKLQSPRHTFASYLNAFLKLLPKPFHSGSTPAFANLIFVNITV